MREAEPTQRVGERTAARRERARTSARRGRRLLLGAGLVVLLAAGLIVARTPASADSRPAGPAWREVFSDSFGGDHLNLAKWTPSRYGQNANEAPYNPDKEAAYYSSGGVSVSGGHAVLTLRKANPWILVNGKYYGYSSGVMTTRGKFAVKPGDFIQARLFVPKGAGLWPAFWMSPSDGSWPPEIDTFEFFNSGTDKRPYFSYLNTKGKWSGPTQYGDAGTDYRNSWHVYGLYWRTDGQLVPYIDGVAQTAVAKQSDSAKSMYIILNLAAQQGYSPSSGAQFRADWVRVYRGL